MKICNMVPSCHGSARRQANSGIHVAADGTADAPPREMLMNKPVTLKRIEW